MPASSRYVSLPVERFTLDNGLRVVLSQDRSAPVVAVAVYYDVGFRSEPEGSTGFAHLFEHMMFQGSAGVAKMEHVKLINGSGGIVNGSTRSDFTNYYQAVPASALDLVLHLEADRMRALNITEENLQNQISVVKEEILVNVINRPYGGFPWIPLAGLMFDTFANAHNGYGSFVDLERASVDDVQRFFDSYYSPGNAVLAIVGDFDLGAATESVGRYFGRIEPRPAPRPRTFPEPLPSSPRTGSHTDTAAPTPAFAVGYRAPDPADLDAVLALEVALALLTDGEASVLQRDLVRDRGLATYVSAWLGVFGGDPVPFERDPTRGQIVVHYGDPGRRQEALDAIETAISSAARGVSPGEVQDVVTTLLTGYSRRMDAFMTRALTLAPFELLSGNAELANEIQPALERISAEAVSGAVATWLRPETRAVLDVTGGRWS